MQQAAARAGQVQHNIGRLQRVAAVAPGPLQRCPTLRTRILYDCITRQSWRRLGVALRVSPSQWATQDPAACCAWGGCSQSLALLILHPHSGTDTTAALQQQVDGLSLLLSAADKPIAASVAAAAA